MRRVRWRGRNLFDRQVHLLARVASRQQAQGNDPAMVKDLQDLIRDMQRLNPNTYANDPLLAERIQSTLMGGIQQVEMELRRKVEDANGTGSVRSPGGEKVPQGYQDKVADYYRKLSKGK